MSPSDPVPSASVPTSSAVRTDVWAFALSLVAVLAAKAGWLPVLPW